MGKEQAIQICTWCKANPVQLCKMMIKMTHIRKDFHFLLTKQAGCAIIILTENYPDSIKIDGNADGIIFDFRGNALLTVELYSTAVFLCQRRDYSALKRSETAARNHPKRLFLMLPDGNETGIRRLKKCYEILSGNERRFMTVPIPLRGK